MGSGRAWPHDLRFLGCFAAEDWGTRRESGPGVMSRVKSFMVRMLLDEGEGPGVMTEDETGVGVSMMMVIKGDDRGR